MYKSFLALFVAMFLVTACSDKSVETSEMMVEDQSIEKTEPMGDVPVEGYEATNTYNNNGVAPGTQQDLVVNVGDRVFFGYDRYDLNSESRAVLDRQAQWLQQYPNLNITVEGHCDERGTREYNLALGDRRANSVQNYLVALGINPSRINTISYGKERPAVMGANPTAWAQNRRGVTIVE